VAQALVFRSTVEIEARLPFMGRHRPSDEKLKELILLIAEWSQADPKFGAIKLNKLLFHCDFSSYLTYGRAITWQEYFALPQGPAPKRLKFLTDRMRENGDLAYKGERYYNHTKKTPIALRPAKIKAFSDQEIVLIQKTIEKFWDKNATEMSEESHLFLGWKAARLKEVIPYSTALVGSRPPTPEERNHGLQLRQLADQALNRAQQ
jgi:hypothetical protein